LRCRGWGRSWRRGCRRNWSRSRSRSRSGFRGSSSNRDRRGGWRWCGSSALSVDTRGPGGVRCAIGVGHARFQGNTESAAGIGTVDISIVASAIIQFTNTWIGALLGLGTSTKAHRAVKWSKWANVASVVAKDECTVASQTGNVNKVGAVIDHGGTVLISLASIPNRASAYTVSLIRSWNAK